MQIWKLTKFAKLRAGNACWSLFWHLAQIICTTECLQKSTFQFKRKPNPVQWFENIFCRKLIIVNWGQNSSTVEKKQNTSCWECFWDNFQMANIFATFGLLDFFAKLGLAWNPFLSWQASCLSENVAHCTNKCLMRI